MFENILVPVDGSEGSLSTLKMAAELAKKFSATIHLQFVVEPPTAHYPPGITFTDDDKTLQWGKTVLAGAFDRLYERGITDVKSSISRGRPTEAILARVEENAIDLVVMGTHSRRGLDRKLLGSVTEEVVCQSPVPVATVRLNSS